MLCSTILRTEGLVLAAINDPYVQPEYMEYMLRESSPPVNAEARAGGLVLDGVHVPVFTGRTPDAIDWASAGVAYVIEASGQFCSRSKAQGHLVGGAAYVVVAAPCDDAPQLVAGINHLSFGGEKVVSAGSSATHCAALLAKVVDEAAGIEEGLISVIAASTLHELQKVQPGPRGGRLSADIRSSREIGSADIVPASLETPAALTRLMPKLAGRLAGSAYRVPGADVSAVDLTCKLRDPAGIEGVKRAVRAACDSAQLRGKVGYREESEGGLDAGLAPDFGAAADLPPCIFDAGSSLGLNDTFVKLVAWFPNEWGYCKQLLELVAHIHVVECGAVVFD